MSACTISTRPPARDPGVAAMIPRIHVTVDAQCDADYPRLRAAQVVLEAADGRSFARYVPEPYGAASNPLSDPVLDAKFTDLAAPRIGGDRARAGLAMLWRTEALADVRGLAEALAG